MAQMYSEETRDTTFAFAKCLFSLASLGELQYILSMGAKKRTVVERVLVETDVPGDPFALLRDWLAQARTTALREPWAMTLATSTADGRPSARMVLLKEINEGGLVFFTSYESRKSSDLISNPHASLLFHWDAFARQIRIEGAVAKVNAEESRKYFATRPRKSQLGAWASRQSAVISGREELESAVKRYEKEFSGVEVPLPPHWGGFRLIPEQIEFWQGRESRLHDRLRYVRSGSDWTIVRLAP
jgi:pyridoxamine 5'-phosphate oxidase